MTNYWSTHLIAFTNLIRNARAVWRVRELSRRHLHENIREGGIWKVFVFKLVEVGARGSVVKRTAGVWRRLGRIDKDLKRLIDTISHTAIR